MDLHTTDLSQSHHRTRHHQITSLPTSSLITSIASSLPSSGQICTDLARRRSSPDPNMPPSRFGSPRRRPLLFRSNLTQNRSDSAVSSSSCLSLLSPLLRSVRTRFPLHLLDPTRISMTRPELTSHLRNCLTIATPAAGSATILHSHR